MNPSATKMGTRPGALIALCATGLTFSLMGMNCQTGTDGNTNLNGTVTGAPAISIGVNSDLDVAANQPFSVVYDLFGDPFEAIAFYDIDGLADSGDEFVLASGLSTGQNQTFLFNTPAIQLGTYHFGIRATNTVGTTTRYALRADGSPADVRVNGLPQPVVNFPNSTREILVGGDTGVPPSVDIVFSCNDPENEVQWQVFYDTNPIQDGAGETLIDSGLNNAAPGASNHTVSWLITPNIPLGTYFIGVVCDETSQSGSEETLYATAQIILTDELSVPTLTVLSPMSDIEISPDTQDKTFQVTWSLSGTAPLTGDAVTVFVDTNAVLEDGGDVTVATGLSPLAGATPPLDASQLADSPPDGYFIGAYVQRNGTAGRPAYASGKLVITGQGTLIATAPAADSTLTVSPGTDVRISWNTSLTDDDGFIALSVQNSDVPGQPGVDAGLDPDPLANAKSLDPGVQTATLDTSNMPTGTYVVEIRFKPTDTEDEELADYTGLIRISTTPFTFWVGHIELTEQQQSNPPVGHFDGLVFEGENFEDNAGSSILGVGNIDDRDGDDVVIGARFAKPNIDNPGGIGSGAAYLVYSDSRFSRGNRRFSLSAVGLDTRDPDDIGGEEPDPNTLPGLVFSGIRFDTGSEDIDNNGVLADGLPTPSGGGCLTEDADGDDKLDRFDEDSNGNLVLDDFEDVDRDLNLDFNEDGRLWIDGNCDGRADTSQPFGAPFFDAQFVNGFVDTVVIEDRDDDGKLDTEGDATYGLTGLGLLPDVDGDEFPELIFGFIDTDSIKPRRSEDANSDFGTLLQPNQFHRGGMVIVPTDHEPAVKDRTLGDIFDEQRIVELDRVGQDFFYFGNLDDDFVETPEDNTGLGIVGTMPADRPVDGMDVFPLVDDVIGESIGGPCDAGQYAVVSVNHSDTNTQAVFRYTVTTNDAPDEVTVGSTPQTVVFTCTGCAEGDEIQIALDEVGTFDPEVDQFDFNGPLWVAPNGGSSASINCGEIAVFALVGPDENNGEFDAFDACTGDADDCPLDAFGDTLGCTEAAGGSAPGQGNSDGCFDTLLGPLFGFSYAGLTAVSGSSVDFEDQSHPLAYDETLSNPEIRAQEFGTFALNGDSGPCNTCGKLVNLPQALREGLSAPPFDTVASGFYAGSIITPVGARILGQGVDDHFGAAVTSLTLPAGQQLAYASSPARNADTGVVYQWRMRQYWDQPSALNPDTGLFIASGGWSTVDGAGGRPKPHQYIMKDLGFDTPNGVTDTIEASIRNAISYSGIAAGDELGTRVLGISDFNAAGGMDLVLTAPGAGSDAGAVYIIYNPSPSQSVDLADIARSPDDPERVDGMIIRGDESSRLGETLAGNCDLNDDGADDVVLGIPGALGGRGEVVIVFGCDDPSNDICENYLNSPANGHSIEGLVNLGVAVRIQGLDTDDLAGFNVDCDGDFTNDGIDDLVLSVPGAVPMYDSDNNDTLDSIGLDLDKDGVPDTDADGNLLLPNPQDAGLIYVIINTKDLFERTANTYSLTEMGSALRGFTFVGAAGGDMLGGGSEAKRSTRSDGLTYAGDVDGDGHSDVLVSAILADPSNKTNAGEVYVIYGFDEEDAAEMLNPDQ